MSGANPAGEESRELDAGLAGASVGKHGGTVAARSGATGRGSTFVVTLPMPPQVPDSTRLPADGGWAGSGP